MNKIEILIQQLDITEEPMVDFVQSLHLRQLVVNEEENKWMFHFGTANLVVLDLYRLLEEKMIERFPYDVEIFFSLEHTSMVQAQYIYDTFEKLLSKEYLDSDFLLQALEFTTMNYQAPRLVVSCGDHYHLDRFVEKQRELEYLFRKLGVDLNIVFNVNEKAQENFENASNDKDKEDRIRAEKHAEEVAAQIQQERSRAQQPKVSRQSASKIQTNFGKTALDKLERIQDAHNIGQISLVEGYVFDKEIRKTRTGKQIATLKITDYTDSIYVSKWLNSDDELADVEKGTWIYAYGRLEIDPYRRNERVIRLSKYETFEKELKKDTAEKKRIELHAHTKMSQLDGVADAGKLVKKAIQYEQPAIAITDHAVVHSFPDAYYASGKHGKTKVLFGCELNVVDYSETKIFYPHFSESNQLAFDDATFIVFDIETTGLSQNYNKMIEIAAVKVKSGMNIDTFERFVNPHEMLSAFTMELTSITQVDVDTAPDLDEVMKDFMEWLGPLDDVVLVAHNAHFDVKFMQSLHMQVFNKPLEINFLDTLQLARHLYPQMKRHGLKAMTKFFQVILDQHHRAIADTKATVDVFLSMSHELKRRDIATLGDINSIVTREREHEIDYSFHMNVLVQNEVGLKNLFKIVSMSHIDYFQREARIPLEKLMEYREGLIFGSGCQNNDVFKSFLSDPREVTIAKMQKYDYIEVQPPHIYSPLLDGGVFKNGDALRAALSEFILLAEEQGKIVCATGDVHQVDERDTILREMYINTQTGMHPLARREITKIPSTHLLTTNEMKQAFNFLGNERQIDRIVVDNTHEVAAMIEEIKVIKDELFTPNMENVDQNVTDMVYDMAHQIYGEQLPKEIVERIEKELESIIKHGFAVIYYICHKIVKKSLDDGYVVGSRGSVGSSLVATLMEITEVNPMPPHYVCPNCHETTFHGGEIGSGFDLPNKDCEKCGTALHKDGHDIPFETFLGFEGDKVPDIDLNFSGAYQPVAHNYTKVLFGEDKVFRAGTISTIAEKTAYGYARNFSEEHPELGLSLLEVDRLTLEAAGVKKTTGRHAGGIIVVPDYMDIYDITPVQYPADGKTSTEWKTTHFDFHAIHDNLLKLDILGHDDPTIIRMLQDLSDIEPTDIPLDDPLVYSLFSSTKALNLQKPITAEVGSLGVPEFGTEFVRQLLVQTNPSTFAELVQISGLSHGTDVWLNNAQVLVQNGTCELKDVIGCRDDIMVYLIYKGLNPSDAFTIMELTRKGNFSEKNEDYIQIMRDHDVPEWYIESCIKIKYMFPKAHAAAYVMSAIRIAWFKVHHPLFFYASLFSVRESGNSFEIDTIMGGYEVIKARILEIEKDEEATNREVATRSILEVVLEMVARGYNFKAVDLYKSHSTDFIVDGDSLVFPFQSVEGLGGNVAKLICEEREIKPFLSKEDLRKRTSISKTVIAKLEVLGVLDDLDDQNQISLF